VTFLEVDKGLRDWRKVTLILHRMFGHSDYILMWIEEMLYRLHNGGSWDGYIGPERQLKGLLWSPPPPTKSLVLINITGGKAINDLPAS
jgi:hypothetical protein